MNEVEEAKQAGQDYISFYQCGFLDGWNRGKKREMLESSIKKIWLISKEAFEKRFALRLQEKIKTRQIGKKEFKLRAKMADDFNKNGEYSKSDLKQLNAYRREK